MKDIVDYAEKSRIRKRKRQFFALLIGLLIGMLPTVNVLAATITIEHFGDPESATVKDGDTIQISFSGAVTFYFKDSDGSNLRREGGITGGNINVGNCGLTDLDHWNMVRTELDMTSAPWMATYVLTAVHTQTNSNGYEKDESEAEEEEEEPVINHNPDAINAHYYLNGMLNDNYLLGKTEQSPLGQIAFNAARPKGWNKAFSMSMSYQGRNEYSKKDGTMVLYVPDAYQKKGRKYAIMSIDKSGNVTILEDTDIYPYLITVSPGLKGYAYELIYSD